MGKSNFVYILLTEKNTLYCGYTDDIEKKEAVLLDRNNKKEQHLIITPSFSRVAVNQDGLHIALYEMGE